MDFSSRREAEARKKATHQISTYPSKAKTKKIAASQIPQIKGITGFLTPQTKKIINNVLLPRRKISFSLVSTS